MSQGEDQNPRTRGGARPGAGRKRKEPEEGFDYSRALKKSLLVEKAKLEMLEAAWSLEPFATGYFDKICFQALYWRAIDTRGDVMTFQDVERLVLEYFNKYWAFVDGKKPLYWGKTQEAADPAPEENFVELIRQGREAEISLVVKKDGIFTCREWAAFEEVMTGLTVLGPEGKMIAAALVWSNSVGRRQLSGVALEPPDVDAPVKGNPFKKVENGQIWLNLWTGFEFTDEFAEQAYLGGLDYLNDFCRFVFEHTCSSNPVHYAYFMDWWAYKVQHPGAKLDTAIILFSATHRAGKGLVCEQLRRIFGEHARQIQNIEKLTNKFNAWLEPMVLIWGDEIQFSGDHAAAQMLKSLQTEPKMNIEGKGKEVRETKNHLAFIYCTNNPHMISADMNDKRYFILEVKAGEQAQMDRIRWQMDNGGRAALFHYLRRVHRVSDSFGTRGLNAPLTEMMRIQKESTARDTHAFCLACVRRGWIVKGPRSWVMDKHKKLLLAEKEGFPGWYFNLLTCEIYESYLQYKRGEMNKYKYNASLGELMNAVALLLGGKQRAYICVTTRAVAWGHEGNSLPEEIKRDSIEEQWTFPTYDETLAHFNRITGLNVPSKFVECLYEEPEQGIYTPLQLVIPQPVELVNPFGPDTPASENSLMLD